LNNVRFIKGEAVQLLREKFDWRPYGGKHYESTYTKFIQSYYQLLKTRYGNGLQLSIDVDKRYYSYLLPSLSLQLLVENAVKHNIVSRLQPLAIEIFSAAGNKMVVNNNLQRKQLSKASTRIGLNNISSKYKLMKQTGFQIIEGESNFMVVLPLVWNDSKEVGT